MKTTTLQLPEPLFEQAVAKARRLGVSQSKVFRDAIENDLAGEKKRHTMLDVMGDLVGCIKGGPSDVSSRHKYYFKQAMLKKYDGKNHR